MIVWEAIKQMRNISQKGGEFSFSFMSYSQDRNKSEGIKNVSRAVLTASSNVAQNRNHDIMINYFDIDNNENRRCYIPLLMEFNNIKLQL